VGAVLGHNQYGKAETRVVRVYRDADPHEVVDYNVSVAVVGDFAGIHVDGDNATCLTTDAMKNTVNAFAKEHGDAAREPETFGLALARHFVTDVDPVHRARITLEMYPWRRLHPHAFARDGGHVRTATVTYDGHDAWVVSGVTHLVLLKTTDSEFSGFLQERYTTLPPTHDRILATSLSASWQYDRIDMDFGTAWRAVRRTLLETFAEHDSRSVQHTLHDMGEAVVRSVDGVASIHLVMPNKHHLPIDLSRFGLENRNEVFVATTEPYGLIEATITR